MKKDQYGQMILDEDDLVYFYYKNNDGKIKRALVTSEITLDQTLDIEDAPKLTLYKPNTISISEFDAIKQELWFLPEQYKNFDIAKWVLEQCSNEAELQRAGEELLLYQEQDLFMLLKYMKYLVDTMRSNKIVWGVGRGSSVASFVLFLIGIHKINSLYYDLDIKEFLR
jgi:DNA polymerase III alpha subunit